MGNLAQAVVQKQQKTLAGQKIATGHPQGMPLHGSILQRAAVIPAITPVHHGILQRCSNGVECEECRRKRLESEGMLQRAAVSAGPVNSVPPIVHEVLGAPGQALDAGTRAFMEPRFGYDFSHVRVHTDARAVESVRAVNALASNIEQDYSPRIWFDPQIDPRLPDYTPAWTENGNIHLSLSSFFMSPYERQVMLRHEAIHSLHQQLAPQSETADAREHAERLAKHGEQNFDRLNSVDFLHPAPALLAFPPKKFSPWTTVWIGKAGIIGEVVEASVSVRIFKRYDEIDQDIKTPESFVCGKRGTSPIQELVKKMQSVARKTAELKAKIPKIATKQQIAMVIIYGDHSYNGFRVFNGKGLVILSKDDFNAGEYEDTIAHESAHAIFEFHSVQKDPAKRIPDALALRIADLYIELSKTEKVPIPTAKFDPNHPPALASSKKTAAGVPKSPSDAGVPEESPSSESKPDTAPAGHVMVMDMLWSGSSGHSWQGVDEFFASAYGGFLKQPGLLRQIVSYYQTADENIKPLAEELFKLLAMVGNLASIKKLPQLAESKRAQETLEKAGAVPEVSTNTEYGSLLDPSKLEAPETILCPGSTESPSQPAEVPLDIDIP